MTAWVGPVLLIYWHKPQLKVQDRMGPKLSNFIVSFTIKFGAHYRNFKCLHLKFELIVNGYYQIMNQLWGLHLKSELVVDIYNLILNWFQMLTFEIWTGCKWLQSNYEPIIRITLEIWTGCRYLQWKNEPIVRLTMRFWG